MKDTKEASAKMTAYDMKFPQMLLRYDDVTSLFIEATDEKGMLRADHMDERPNKNEDGTYENITGD